MADRQRFTCRGQERGECGVVHRSKAAAERCCERDSRAIQRALRSEAIPEQPEWGPLGPTPEWREWRDLHWGQGVCERLRRTLRTDRVAVEEGS